MMTLLGVARGIWPWICQPAKRKTHLENLFNKGLSTGVVKIVKRIQLLEKVIPQQYHQIHAP